jgi:hypothetical protein
MPYRGNFTVLNNGGDRVDVYDTTFADESDSLARQRSGVLTLRWQKIVSGEDGKHYYSIPCAKVTDAPVLSNFKVDRNGWLLLQMQRVNTTAADLTFQDEYLGNVALNFSWIFKNSIPEPDSTKVCLAVAGIVFDRSGEMPEIVQQQFGPAELWIPLAAGDPEESQSSDSESISDSSSSISESASSDSRSSDSSGSISDSSSSDDHDDSSSSDDPPVTVYVTLHYREDSYVADPAAPDGVGLLYGEVWLNGSFVVSGKYPDEGYQLILTGMQEYFDGANPTTEDIVHTMTVYRDEANGFWDFYDHDANEWGEWYDINDTANDIIASTPVYDHPLLKDHPRYPLGNLRVDHEIINGVTEAAPHYTLESSLIINFSL